jgi:hypothetical protein
MAATAATCTSAGAVLEEKQASQGPQQRVAQGDYVHVDTCNKVRAAHAGVSEGSFPRAPFQSGSLGMGSAPTLGSIGSGGGFQLGQQHLVAQDVEEMLQRSIGTHPSDVPCPGTSGSARIAGEAGVCEQSQSPARPCREPQTQRTPCHSSGKGCFFRASGALGSDLPGCIPDTPSGSEGPTGQQLASPSTMMQPVRSSLCYRSR